MNEDQKNESFSEELMPALVPYFFILLDSRMDSNLTKKRGIVYTSGSPLFFMPIKFLFAQNIDIFRSASSVSTFQ